MSSACSSALAPTALGGHSLPPPSGFPCVLCAPASKPGPTAHA